MTLQSVLEQQEPPSAAPDRASLEPRAAESSTSAHQSSRSRHFGRRKVRIGRVISNKPNKTIVVAIERDIMHPLYKKTYRRTTKVMAHDESNQCNVGDIVKLVEWRPLSRHKRWMLVEILQRSHQVGEGDVL